MHSLSRIAEKAVALVYPNRCLACNKITPLKYFCKDCTGLLNPIKLKLCTKCGLPRKYCACKWNFYYFDKMLSCFEADEITKNAFYSFKFGGNLMGAKYFSSHMSRKIKNSSNVPNIDFITSVPSHKSTLNERGYDQVKLLAKGISKDLKIKYVKLLNQPGKTPKQHESTDIKERFLNVSGKYSVLKNKNLNGKTVLLVDDIKTTGATLSQCARELKLSGAEKVIAVTALTVYPKSEKIKKQTVEK